MGRARILLIDDEVNLSKMIKLNLERTGKYEVVTADSGEAGVRCVAAEPFDAVITDFNMPGMNGQQTAEAIKRIKPELPVLLLSVYHDDPTMVTASTKRIIDGIISKPIDHGELHRALTEILAKRPNVKKKRILVVDDEADYAKLLKLNIEKNSEYAVALAANGQEGLAAIKQEKPDLVLLDITMPVMDGFQALKEIKRIAPEIPVAVVSACWNEEEAKRIMAAGAYEYITKPIDFNHLHDALLIKLFG